MVTGGAGFIGSHACKHLANAGLLPVTIDNLSTGHSTDVRWGPFYEVDTRDTEAVQRIIGMHKINTVMHFAASAYVGESVINPARYYDNNVGGMIALLEACRKTEIKRFIFSSSCATYGIPKNLPISEDARQEPINPYGRTKLICEQMLADYNCAYGLDHVILRYFNACGADPEGDLGEKHTPETHFIPLALMTAAGKIDCLDIYGSDYDTPDGTCVRDFIHVDDLARGHVLAYEYLAGGGRNVAVNLGSGNGHSILTVIKVIEHLCGRKVPTRMRPRRSGDPPALYANPSRARQLFRFTAEFSDIETIVRDAAPSFGLELNEMSHAEHA